VKLFALRECSHEHGASTSSACDAWGQEMMKEMRRVECDIGN